MRRFNQLTLKNKIFISSLGFTLVISILIALFTRGLLISSLTGELKGRGLGIAQRVADSCRVFILTKNRAELTAMAYDARLGDRKGIVLYLIISDEEGEILAHTFTTGLPPGMRARVKNMDTSGEEIKSLRISAHSVFNVSVPIKEGIYTIGSVHLGLDRGHIETLISRLRLIFLSFLSVVSILFFFLSHRLALHITKPVTALIRYADQLTRGNLHLISTGDLNKMSMELGSRHDEIATLTNSFIRMTGELKHSTDNLKDSRIKYRSLFRSGPNPIFVIHKHSFEILDANPQALELFGYDQRSLVGMSLLCLGELDNKAFSKTYPKEKSIVISSRVKFFKKDGKALFVNIHASPAQYRDKDVLIVAATDISELVEKDSQLIQASKMTNLEKMSAGIAHEINQPLNAIKMGSEYLIMLKEQKKEVDPGEMDMVLREISTQVTRASEIVGRLKTFSRKADFSREVISLNQCVEAVHKMLGRQIGLQNMDLILSLDKSIPCILAHNNRMEQVIFNLVTNARDAVNERVEEKMDIKQGRIEISSFSDHGMVGLTVADNGMGILPENLDSVFDSFFTTKEMGEGLGLGLPIIQGIVKDYNGTISVQSTPGKGASFRLLFPAHGKQQSFDLGIQASVPRTTTRTKLQT